MRPITSLRLLAAAFAPLLACGDSVTRAASPTVPPASPPQLTGSIGVVAREIPLGASIALAGPLHSYADAVAGPYLWRTKDASVALANPGVGHSSYVKATGIGTTELYVSNAGVRATVPITVLDTLSSAVSPAVVEDFHVIEVGGGGGWGYVPYLVLRDTIGRLESALIGFTLELPGAGRTAPCAMLRRITGSLDPVFRERYGEPEFWVNGPPGYRVPAGELATARLTLRVPGPYAKDVTVKGPVVPGDWPTTYTAEVIGDVLSCGSAPS